MMRQDRLGLGIDCGEGEKRSGSEQIQADSPNHCFSFERGVLLGGDRLACLGTGSPFVDVDYHPESEMGEKNLGLAFDLMGGKFMWTRRKT
jgi:hypothetical protein